eukprot:gene34974-43127_t
MKQYNVDTSTTQRNVSNINHPVLNVEQDDYGLHFGIQPFEDPSNVVDASQLKFPRKSSTWTPEMDNRLREGAILYDNKWQLVAEFMNNEKTADQCYNRWARYANPALDNCKKTKWTEEEMQLFSELIEANQKTDKNGTVIIAWSVVCRQLNRTEMDCHNKYRNMCVSQAKKGHFSVDEDNQINQRVRENGGMDMENFWVRLANEMNRVKVSVQKRWETLQKASTIEGYVRPLFWTEEMDARLVSAVNTHHTNWKLVSDYVGFGVNADAVRRRWKCKADPSLTSTPKKDQPWTEEE